MNHHFAETKKQNGSSAKYLFLIDCHHLLKNQELSLIAMLFGLNY